MTTAPSALPFPRLTVRWSAPQAEINQAIQRWADDVVLHQQTLVIEQASASGQTFYDVLGGTPTYTLDAGSPSTMNTANVLATLIQDLKIKGVIA